MRPRPTKLRAGDVVQLRAERQFLGRLVGGLVCTVADTIHARGPVDLLLVDPYGWPVLATSDDVTLIRRGVIA